MLVSRFWHAEFLFHVEYYVLFLRRNLVRSYGFFSRQNGLRALKLLRWQGHFILAWKFIGVFAPATLNALIFGSIHHERITVKLAQEQNQLLLANPSGYSKSARQNSCPHPFARASGINTALSIGVFAKKCLKVHTTGERFFWCCAAQHQKRSWSTITAALSPPKIAHPYHVDCSIAVNTALFIFVLILLNILYSHCILLELFHIDQY